MSKPVIIHQNGSCFFKECAKVHSISHVKTFFDSFCNRMFVFLMKLPQKRLTGVSPCACIRKIKDIVKLNIITAGINERNALGTPAHITVHGVVPYIVGGTGHGIRALGMNQKLVGIRILVQPRSRLKKRRPAFIAGRKLLCGILRKLHICLQFIRHVHPPRQK